MKNPLRYRNGAGLNIALQRGDCVSCLEVRVGTCRPRGSLGETELLQRLERRVVEVERGSGGHLEDGWNSEETADIPAMGCLAHAWCRDAGDVRLFDDDRLASC
jgi:hypothetical protein